jgi:hypothetical protein
MKLRVIWDIAPCSRVEVYRLSGVRTASIIRTMRGSKILHINIVTYPGFSIHDGTLLHTKSQYTTVKHSRQLLEHTYTSDLYGLGTPTPIEFFQQGLLWQLPTLTSILTVRRLLNTRRENPSSGYRSTCTPQRHLGVYIINQPFTSRDTQARLSSNNSQTTLSKSIEVRRQQSRYYGTQLQLVYIVA